MEIKKYTWEIIMTFLIIITVVGFASAFDGQEIFDNLQVGGNLSVLDGNLNVTSTDGSKILFFDVILELLGIGTANPSETLTVIGTLNISNTTGSLGLFQGTDARVAIGTNTPSSFSQLHVVGGNGAIELASALGDGVVKNARYLMTHFNATEEPFTLLTASAQATANTIEYGSGQGLFNSATELRFITAETTTTLIGVDRMTIKKDGKVGFGNNAPQEVVDVTGNIRLSGDLFVNGGDITSSSGAISFGNEDLSTTGTLEAGNTEITGNLNVSIDGIFQDDIIVIDDAIIRGTIFDDQGILTLDDTVLITGDVEMEKDNPILKLDDNNGGVSRIVQIGNQIFFQSAIIESGGSAGSFSFASWFNSDVWLQITNIGRIGMGLSNPQVNLHILGSSNPTIRLEEGTSAGVSFFEIIESQPSQAIIKQVCPGTCLIDIDPLVSDNAGDSSFRFFRNTDTSGVAKVTYFKPDGAAGAGSEIITSGGNSYFNADGGNLGIGDQFPDAIFEISFSGDTGVEFMISSDDNNDGDLFNIDSDGVVNITGELIGSRQTITWGSGSTKAHNIATGLTRYYNGPGNAVMTTSKGFIATHDGSITAVSAMFDIISKSDSTDVLTMSVRVNDTIVFSQIWSANGEGTANDITKFQTQARGVDTFFAGDRITVSTTATGIVSTDIITVDDTFGMLEVVYDSVV